MAANVLYHLHHWETYWQLCCRWIRVGNQSKAAHRAMGSDLLAGDQQWVKHSAGGKPAACGFFFILLFCFSLSESSIAPPEGKLFAWTPNIQQPFNFHLQVYLNLISSCNSIYTSLNGQKWVLLVIWVMRSLCLRFIYNCTLCIFVLSKYHLIIRFTLMSDVKRLYLPGWKKDWIKHWMHCLSHGKKYIKLHGMHVQHDKQIKI